MASNLLTQKEEFLIKKKKNHSWLTLLFSKTLCLASYCHWGNSFSSYFSTDQYILLKFFY